jgi:channel protein (hemolysin III family)
MPIVPHQIAAFGAIAEPFASLSHLLAAAVFAVLTFRLVRVARTGAGRTTAAAIFAGSVVVLLISSGIYHWSPVGGDLRSFLQRLDHAAIFVLIAGTYTPICVYLLSRRVRKPLLIAIWVIASLGVAAKLFFFDSIPDSVSTAAYLAAGWLGVVAAVDLSRKRPALRSRLLILGGLTYTAGILTEALFHPVLIHGVVGGHEIFHIAVVLGLGLHWAFISGALRGIPLLVKSIPEPA